MMYFGVFAALVVADFLCALYVRAVVKKRPNLASFISVACNALAYFAIIAIVEDSYAIVAALCGAFVGTQLGLRIAP